MTSSIKWGIVLFFSFLVSFPLAADSFRSGSEGNVAEISEQAPLVVKGKVIDSSGQPVPGVGVLIKGTVNGTVTDMNGYYVIQVPSAGVVLEFSSLGPKSLALDIFLEDDTLEMEEAVVVGMGHQRKASVIGAISSVVKDELQIPQRNLTNALAGKVAGAVVVQRTGEPGMDNAEFWIRGISSLNSSAPLVYQYLRMLLLLLSMEYVRQMVSFW